MYTAPVHRHNSKGMQRSTAGLSQKLRCDTLLKKLLETTHFCPRETFVDIPKCFLLPTEKKDWVAPCGESTDVSYGTSVEAWEAP